MRTRLLILCTVSVVAIQSVTFARKTEVAVRKGEVLAETAAASVAIGAGRKAVLETDRKPTVSVDNPLVDDALELYKLIEAEKENSELKIDSAFILVGKADKDEIVGALFFEVPNYRPAATKVLTLPSVSIMEDFEVYDMSGNLCRVDMKRLDESTASYSIHFSETLQPGERFKFVGVANLQDVPALPGGAPTYWKEGPLWYFRTINGVSNCLNYFRLIFPSSAIFVDTNREIVATDTVDGKLAVTMRNYTGPYADGLCIVSFLWPDEDGTTLADIPDKYHGLRSRRDRQDAETFRREMHRIRAGIRYTDQRTPLAALLTCYGSALQEDTELYNTVKYTYQAPDSIQKWVKNARYFADRLDFLSMPQWPDNPGNGYVHPIYMSRRGSLIDEFIMPMVYEDGKWYAHNTKGKQTVDYENATSEDIATAKAEGYLCDWEVAGPYMKRGKDYRDLHDIAFGPELPDADITWLPATIISDDKHPVLVSIDKSIMHFNDSVAYLRTEIVSETRKPARLEIYTDDGVKTWLNGKLIFENNVGRGIPDQPDTVNVTLKEGTNHLQLKVTEAVWGSRAIVRIGSDRAAGPRPADKAIHPKTQVQLGWTPAATAQSHLVYLGSDQNDLSLLTQLSDPQELQPLSVEPDRRYYWRVDEILADGSRIEGHVWSFATSQQVAFWTFDGHARDKSLQAFHGSLHGNPRWVPGVSNQAVALDTEEDYIIIPPMNLSTDTITITLWVKTEEIIENPGLVFTRGGTTCAGLWFNMDNNLRYNWNDDRETWLWDSGLFAPNKTWTFAALVIDPKKATVYMHDGTAMKSATHNHGHGAKEFDSVTYIGHDPRWSTVKGAIDEVRIYNYALGAKEIEAIYLETAGKS